MDNCPSEEQLAGFSAGNCPDEEASGIRAHVETCSLCAQWVAEAKSNEALLPSMRDAMSAWDGQAAPEHGMVGADGSPETGPVPGLHPASPRMPAIEGYEFIRELHRGGQGVVYEALQRSTRRKVAVKVLLEQPSASATARKRFEREIELVASLKHPSIIAVFDSGVTTDGQQFCVMDYVRGQTLNQYVRERKLGLEDTLALFGTVCKAVNYAHQKGVIHRDLKPSNILVDSDGNPKVLDFGLAKTVGGPEQSVISLTGQVVGTLPYMSPEQARGNPDEIDIRTDVYALGVILYELLTGHYPYPVAGNMIDVLKHIAETPPTPPTRAWAADSGVTKRSAKRLRGGQCPIDGEIETIVLQALSKDRERRYQGAGELARDIGHYLAGEPIDAKRDSTLYVLGRILRRYLVHTAVTAAVTAAVVTLLVRNIMQEIEISRLSQRLAVVMASHEGERSDWPAADNDAAVPDTQFDDTPGLRPTAQMLERRIETIERMTGHAEALRPLVSQGDYAGAIKYLDDQLSHAPDKAYLLSHRAYVAVRQYVATGNDEFLNSAEHDYRKSMVLDPAYAAAAHEGIGWVFHLRAKQSGTEDDYLRALDEYTKAISLQADFPRAYSNRGHAYFDMHRHALAATDYAVAVAAGLKRLSESVPDAWRTYFNYGTTLRLLGASEEAAKQYEDAVKAAPNDLYCDAALALAYLDAGRGADADTCLGRAKGKKKPETWEGKFVRCLSLDLPPEQLIEVADSEGEKCEAYYYAGEAWARLGEQEDARRAFRDCLEECGATGKTGFNEYRWAEWRLGQMDPPKEAD